MKFLSRVAVVIAGVIAVGLACLPVAVCAQGASDQTGVQWEQLTNEQRQLLGNVQADWNKLPPQRQRALARGAERWLAMGEEQRGQAQQRFRQWQSLSQDERREIRRR